MAELYANPVDKCRICINVSKSLVRSWAHSGNRNVYTCKLGLNPLVDGECKYKRSPNHDPAYLRVLEKKKPNNEKWLNYI